ncbi:Swi3-domain-containing protein [Ganoderma leucocontextum]|nr:Swi3-domain-containing protein [Ganoderma leucocontextum]
MASLDDIWDTPADSVSAPSNPAPISVDDDDDDVFTNQPKRSNARPRSTLFLDSGSEDDAPSTSKAHYASKPASSKPDIDAFWDDLDAPDTAFQGLAPSLDVEALKRQADATLPSLTPHQILLSSSPPRDPANGKDGAKDTADGKKGDKGTTKKKRRPILDEGRLLGPEGFPVLVKQAKEFKPKGKGHELSDLNRLFTVYQFWSHGMYPNTQFVDTVQRVEKLCHTKRMHVALGVWRDEAKGLINGHNPNASDGSDSDDSDKDVGGPPATDVPIVTEDDSRSSPAPSRGPSLPPSSASEGGFDDDFDIDAMIAEDEAARAHPSTTSDGSGPAAPAPSKSSPADEDEEMWDAVMADFPDEPYAPPERQPSALKPSVQAADEDEEMWDIVREMEAEAAAKTTASSAPASEGAPMLPAEGVAALRVGVDLTKKATNDEGWDEMYA